MTFQIIRNGRSQAVRLPREFHFEGDRVRIRRTDQGVLLEPLISDAAKWFEELDRFDQERFMVKGRRNQPITFDRKRLEAFFAGPLHLLPFANEDAEIAAATRAELEANGRPIGAYDLLIAGQAMRNRLTLVTANLSEFARIKTLTWADWENRSFRRRKLESRDGR